MRRSEAALALVLLSLVLFWIAIALRSWWLTALGIAGVITSLLVTPGGVGRVLPRRSVVFALCALVGLVAANAVLQTLSPAPGEVPRRGVALEGEWVALGALLVVSAAVVSVLALFWVAAWRAIEEDRPAWKKRAYVSCLAVFLLAPVVFLLFEYALEPGHPDAEAYYTRLLIVLSVAACGAAALPHINRRLLDGWGLSGPPSEAD